MGCEKNLKAFLFNIDLFGKEPKLYYKGKSKIKTLLGNISTIIYTIIYISFFAYKINLMLKKKDVNYYETTVNTEIIPTIQLTNEIFYPAFALISPLTLAPYIDNSIYFVEAYFMTRKKGHWNSIPLELEKCKIENFGSKYRGSFQNIGDLYCIKRVNYLFEGNIDSDNHSYFLINFYPCVKQSYCGAQLLVEAYLADTSIYFYFEDIELTPQIYKNPVKFRKREIYYNIKKDLIYKYKLNLQKIKIETDEDNIGFNEIIKTKNYLKYDSISYLNAPSKTYEDIFKSGGLLEEVKIELSESVFTIRRKYTKLIDVLGTVGGFMGIIYSCFQICISFLTDILYDISLINNLFAVDLDKKSLIIKSLKIQNLKQEERTIEIKPTKELIEISSERKINLNMKNNIKISNSKKIINLGGTKIIDNKFYNKNENNISDIKDLNKEQVDKENEIEYKRDKEEKVNIKEINLNIFRDYFCFYCKKKNSQKKILNKAMEIIYEKNDIINLFRILYFYDINKDKKDK